MSAWPASRTDPAPVLAEDRWTRRFDLFDRARALENQIVWVSANQAGTFGSTCSSSPAPRSSTRAARSSPPPGTEAGLAVADGRRRRRRGRRPPVHGPPARPAARVVPGRAGRRAAGRPPSPRAPARRARVVRLAAAAAHFTRDLEFDLDRIDDDHRARAGRRGRPAGAARRRARRLPRRPARPRPDGRPAAAARAGRRRGPRRCRFAGEHGGLRRLLRAAVPTRRNGLVRYNAAVCVTGDGVLGRHRKVHLPRRRSPPLFAAGDGFAAFDTPVGRMGMLIDYDKTFPEAARVLALDGAEIIACLSAWPTSLTNRAPRMAQDRQARLFDLYDQARAAENQVVWLSSNQTGRYGGAALPGPGQGRRAGRRHPRPHLVEGRAGGRRGRRARRWSRRPGGAAPPRRAAPGAPTGDCVQDRPARPTRPSRAAVWCTRSRSPRRSPAPGRT